MDFGRLSPQLLQRCLTQPGGYAWWYLDLVDPLGNGLVCLWSWGLPFLPGSREGRAAAARPAVGLALYEGGKVRAYLLQEHPLQTNCIPNTDGNARLGDSTFEVCRANGQLALHLELDEVVPPGRERLHARVRVTGVEAELPDAPADSPHLWTPRLLHARASAEVRLGARHFELEGVGYFDGNAATVPLHAQGIEHWRWGRLSGESKTWVVYELQGASPQSLLLEGDDLGRWRHLPERPTWLPDGRGLYGVRAPKGLRCELPEGTLQLTRMQAVEDGPFYRRFLTSGTLLGAGTPETLSGSFEVVAPARLDLPWQRPFVRMRTHRVGADNSLWLPLFSGLAEDRWERWLQGCAGRVTRLGGRP